MSITLDTGKDPMGTAIAEYYAKGKAAKLRVFSSQFYEDEIPVDTLLRRRDEATGHRCQCGGFLRQDLRREVRHHPDGHERHSGQDRTPARVL